MLHNIWPLLGSMGLVIGLGFGSLGLGRLVFRQLATSPRQPVSEIVFSLGLGLALLSYVIFTFSALRLLSYPLLLGLSLAWISAGVLNFRLPPLALGHSEAGVFKSPGSKLLAALLLVYLFLNLIPVLAPAWDWDGLAYHLALPKIYLAAGGFVFRPDIYHNLFPQLLEMLYLPGLLFPYGLAPKLMHFGFGLLAAAAIYALLRELGFQTSALFGALVFYVQYIVQIESSAAFIDLGTAAYTSLAGLAFWQALRSKTVSAPEYLCALFAGLAAATKWHGLIILGLAIALLQIKIWFSVELSAVTRLRHSLGTLAFSSLPVLPYLLRAWILGGNPLWPLAYSWFGGNQWDAQIDQLVTQQIQHFAGATNGWVGFLLLPFDLLTQGARFGAGGREFQAPLLGICLLLGLRLAYHPSLRQASRPLGAKSPWPGLWALAGFAYLLIWFFSSPQFRFLLPLLVLLAPWAAGLIARLRDLSKPGAKGLALLAALLLLWVHPPIHRDTVEQLQAALGLMPAEDFLEQRLPAHAAMRYLNQQVPEGERVLLFQENRGFYLNADYLWGDPLNQAQILYARLGTPEKLYQRLRELGVRWILYAGAPGYDQRYYTPEILSQMNGMLQMRAEEKFSAPHAKVFRLQD